MESRRAKRFFQGRISKKKREGDVEALKRKSNGFI